MQATYQTDSSPIRSVNNIYKNIVRLWSKNRKQRKRYAHIST